MEIREKPIRRGEGKDALMIMKKGRDSNTSGAATEMISAVR